MWWQDHQHTLRASFPTVQTTLDSANGLNMPTECGAAVVSSPSVLATRKLHTSRQSHCTHTAAPPSRPAAPPAARRGRAWYMARGGTQKQVAERRRAPADCRLTPCQSSSSARRIQLGRPRVPRTVMALGNAVAHNDGGVKRRCAPIRLQQQHRMLCWCARSISRRALCVVPGLTQHQHRRRAFEKCSGAAAVCLRSLCSAPATPGRRRRAQLGRARRAQRRRNFTGHAATRGRWWLRRRRVPPSQLLLLCDMSIGCAHRGHLRARSIRAPGGPLRCGARPLPPCASALLLGIGATMRCVGRGCALLRRTVCRVCTGSHGARAAAQSLRACD
jgi:hypothetical protein